MGVSRYTIEENLAHYDPNGQWVLYEDHAPVMAARDGEIAALRSGLIKLADLCAHLLRNNAATPKVADATPDVAAPQPAPPGLRWGVRSPMSGEIIARFDKPGDARSYIKHGRWYPHKPTLVDLAPEPTTAGPG